MFSHSNQSDEFSSVYSRSSSNSVSSPRTVSSEKQNMSPPARKLSLLKSRTSSPLRHRDRALSDSLSFLHVEPRSRQGRYRMGGTIPSRSSGMSVSTSDSTPTISRNSIREDDTSSYVNGPNPVRYVSLPVLFSSKWMEARVLSPLSLTCYHCRYRCHH